MNYEITNQVIALSLIYAKNNGLDILIKIVTNNNKFPLVSIEKIDVIDFSYYICNKKFNKNFDKNLLNDWRALNLYYLLLLNFPINFNININKKTIPFFKFDINYLSYKIFNTSIFTIIKVYNNYLNNFNIIKNSVIDKIKITLIKFKYNDYINLIEKEKQKDKIKSQNEINDIKKCIINVQNFMLDNNNNI